MAEPTAAVIGAGPVGCLTALGLQRRGYRVVVFERRTEESFAPTYAQLTAPQNDDQASASSSSMPVSRSINLAISVRGLTALRSVDDHLADIVLENAVPMHGRMIHQNVTADTTALRKGVKGDHAEDRVALASQKYSSKGECINSVSRALLSRLLLDQVVQHGIEVRWNQRVQSIDFSKGEEALIAVEGDGPPQVIAFDAVFGCDGHHSKVRSAMQTVTDINASESTVDNYYLELHIAPGYDASRKTKTYALDPHHLHIWPRHEFMLIALPNRDKSFTSTLFAPKAVFEQHFGQPEAIVSFFAKEFPDALRLIGKEALIKQVHGHRPSVLGTVQCDSYHLDAKAILLGDAAHAMVPFYGQGLNCGLEDVRVMFELFDEEQRCRKQAESQRVAASSARRAAFTNYSLRRKDDLLAIQRLAMDNFHEMSSKVVSPSFILRKRVDGLLQRYLPAGWWASLYENVTFSNVGYATVRKREARQALFLDAFASTFLVGSLAGLSYASMRALHYWQRR